MKVQLFSMLVIAVAFASLTYKPAAPERAEPEAIDFADLNSQAATALHALQSLEQHGGTQTAAAF